jgi:hypothetical protein
MASDDQEPLGPLDDEPDDVIKALRKLRAYDDFDTFLGEIDGLTSLLKMFQEGADETEDHYEGMLLRFLQDMLLMMAHTRMMVEHVLKNQERPDIDPADWWKPGSDEEDEEEDG